MIEPITCVCPRCHAQLEQREASLACTGCKTSYPVRDGIPLFQEAEPETVYDAVEPWDRGASGLQLAFVDAGITRFISRHLPRPTRRLLDVGCGAGIRLLARRADAVCGIDLSLARLKAAARIYREVAYAGITAIPYPDDFFDVVLSVDVLEHVPAEAKDHALQEMIRVVRPGGRLIHLLDCDSQKPLHRWARLHPELYRKHFIEKMGHHGLETASAALARFARFPLNLIAVEASNRTILQHPENYAWQFDNEYLRHSFTVRALTSASHFVRRHPCLRAAYSGFFELVWKRIERIFPLDWSFNLAVAYEVKKKSAMSNSLP